MRRALWAVVLLCLGVAGYVFADPLAKVFNQDVEVSEDLDSVRLQQVKYPHRYATSGTGTSGDPWDGWTSLSITDGDRIHFAKGYYTLSSHSCAAFELRRTFLKAVHSVLANVVETMPRPPSD